MDQFALCIDVNGTTDSLHRFNRETCDKSACRWISKSASRPPPSIFNSPGHREFESKVSIGSENSLVAYCLMKAGV